MDRPPLVNGAVALEDGLILAVGSLAELTARYPSAEIKDHPGCVLMPGLVNAHTHLELSHMHHLGQVPNTGTFTEWVAALVAYRLKAKVGVEEIRDAAQAAADEMHRTGIAAIGDIGNTTVGRLIRFPGMVVHWKEYLGNVDAILERRLVELAAEPATQACTGHAPYSTHRRLIQALKARAEAMGTMLSMHVAEPASEIEYLQRGTGEFRTFAEERGFWDGSFRPLESDAGGSITYLDSLGVLDANTLCVHAIHVAPEEADLLARRNAKVCLCPGSNRQLGVGIAPVARYLERGILPGLGTDSRASNPTLSLWQEMALLRQSHPDLDPETVLAMATRGGAAALGIEDAYGILAPGRPAMILCIELPNHVDLPVIFDHLTTAGSALQPRWLREDLP